MPMIIVSPLSGGARMSAGMVAHGSRWYESPRFRALALVAIIIVMIVEGVIAIGFRDNDFQCHREIGAYFLAGDMEKAQYFIMYPVGRLMMNGLLAIGPLHLTRAVSYLLAIGAIYACIRIWRRLSDSAYPTTDAATFAAAVFTGLLMISYLMRDLDERGLQLFLLFFITMGLFDLIAGRHVRAGFWLGTAVTYKVTPLLFLPYLLWKRQWRAAAWMVVFIGVWAAAPALYLGPQRALESNERWFAHVRKLMANRQAYPDQLVEPQRTDNLSLAALLARNLETYPPGHDLYVDHPLFFQPGSLAPEHAYYAVRFLLLALVLVLAWNFRGRFTGSEGMNRLVIEWSAVCLLSSILSPVCWKQHMVLALPALFLVVRHTLTAPRSAWRVGALMAIGIAANLRSSFVGKDLAVLVHVYKIDTLALLAVLVLLLTLPDTVQAGDAQTSEPLPFSSPKARAA
jgi:hypothetical protein